MEIIDLDDPGSSLYEVESPSWYEVHDALNVLYIQQKITNSQRITLQVWFGLQKKIHHTEERFLPALGLKIASIQATESSPSYLMGASMILGDIATYYSLEDQKRLLSLLRQRSGE